MTPDFTERAKELRIQIDRCLPGTRDDWTTWNQDVEQACIGALEAAYLEGTQREDRVCVMCADEGYEAGYADGVEASAKVADSGCDLCHGAGWVEITIPAHAPGCDGSCRNCPVPERDQEPCIEDVHVTARAIRALSEKEAPDEKA